MSVITLNCVDCVLSEPGLIDWETVLSLHSGRVEVCMTRLFDSGDILCHVAF